MKRHHNLLSSVSVLGGPLSRGSIMRAHGAYGGGFDFYVDSVSGSDANDGTSEAAAFSTLGTAETAALAFGDGVSIGLAAGSEWPEALDLPTLSGVKITGYGDMATSGIPNVRADDEITGTFSTSTDRADAFPNTYSIQWAHTIEAGSQNGGPTVLSPAGEVLRWRSSIALVDANPGSFYHDGATSDTTPVNLYIHTADSTNPTGQGYTATRRHTAIRVGDDATVSFVRVNAAGNSLGSLVGGRRCTAIGVLATGNLIHDVNLYSGTMRKCVGWRPHIGNGFGAISLEFFAPDPQSETGLWDKCIVRGPEGARTEGCAAFGGHNSGSGTWTSLTARDCATHNCEISAEDTDAFIMERVNMKNGSILAAGVSATITDLQLIRDEDVYPTRNYCIQSTTNAPLIVEGGRIYTNVSSDDVFVNPQNLTLTQSIVVNQSTGSVLEMAGTVTQQNAIVTNNIFVSPIAVLIYNVRNYTSNSGTLSSDFNVLYPFGTNATDSIIYRGPNGSGGFFDRFTLASVRSTFTQELNSADTNPSIADPANGDWTVGGSVGSTGAGLDRPDIAYTPIPATLAEAEAWILAA